MDINEIYMNKMAMFFESLTSDRCDASTRFWFVLLGCFRRGRTWFLPTTLLSLPVKLFLQASSVCI